MTAITITEARKTLYQLVAETAKRHMPLIIKGKHNNAVLVSEEDWQALQETIYLTSVPCMVQSIKEGMQTPVSEMSDKLDW